MDPLQRALASLLTRLRALGHRLLHPSGKVVARVGVCALIVFIYYFQFFYGPWPWTLAVLALTAYAGALCWFYANSWLASHREGGKSHPRLAAFAARLDLRTTWGFRLSACFEILYCCFCLLMARYGRFAWFAAMGVYNLVHFFIDVFAAHELRALAQLEPDESRSREQRDVRIIGTLLLVLSVAFFGVTLVVIVGNETHHWPAFWLAFQILYTFVRLALALGDAVRARHARPLRRAMQAVRFMVGLVALFTTQATYLARFMSGDRLRLALNLLSAAIILVIGFRLSLTVLQSGDTEERKS